MRTMPVAPALRLRSVAPAAVHANGTRRGEAPFVPRSPAAPPVRDGMLRPYESIGEGSDGRGGSPMGVGAGLKPAPTRRSAHVPVARGHANMERRWGADCAASVPPGFIRMERVGATAPFVPRSPAARRARRHARPYGTRARLRGRGGSPMIGRGGFETRPYDDGRLTFPCTRSCEWNRRGDACVAPTTTRAGPKWPSDASLHMSEMRLAPTPPRPGECGSTNS